MLDNEFLDCQVAYLDKYKKFYLILEGQIKVSSKFNEGSDEKYRYFTTRDVIGGENANIQ